MRKKITVPKIFLHSFFIIYSLLCIVPFLLVVSVSFTAEDTVIKGGFGLWPSAFSTEAYRHLFSDASKLMYSYGVTAFYAFAGTALSVVIMAMAGYALSRNRFILKKPMTWMLLVTMFFNGGLIPSYIVNTRLFGLGNNIMIYIFYDLVTAYTIFVFRAFFKQIPASLVEAAAIEGAGELKILTKVIIPLSKPVLATYGFIGLVGRWNDFSASLYYITESKLYTIQRLLQEVLNEAKFLQEFQKATGTMIGNTIPSETLKFAICVVGSAPMLFAFPFFQKFFSKGIVVGAVKG